MKCLAYSLVTPRMQNLSAQVSTTGTGCSYCRISAELCEECAANLLNTGKYSGSAFCITFWGQQGFPRAARTSLDLCYVASFCHYIWVFRPSASRKKCVSCVGLYNNTAIARPEGKDKPLSSACIKIHKSWSHWPPTALGLGAAPHVFSYTGLY